MNRRRRHQRIEMGAKFVRASKVQPAIMALITANTWMEHSTPANRLFLFCKLTKNSTRGLAGYNNWTLDRASTTKTFCNEARPSLPKNCTKIFEMFMGRVCCRVRARVCVCASSFRRISFNCDMCVSGRAGVLSSSRFYAVRVVWVCCRVVWCECVWRVIKTEA